jgi:Cdc6-like AAA superfamily ATPase
MYICGPPGTGKTALMTEIFGEFKSCPSNKAVKTAFVNCMSFERAEEVYERIMEECGTAKKGAVDALLEKLFLKSKSMMYHPVWGNLLTKVWSF